MAAYSAIIHLVRMKRASLFFFSAVVAFGQAQPAQLSPVFVTATRASEAGDTLPFSHQTVSGDSLRSSANLTIDGTLRSIPGFSLFRRSDSLVANPTTQGVSLRGLGPSGASRSLILLDGVPLNDPFGGWVLWSKVPRESMAGIEIVPGAGGTAWGNAALGGVIQLFTEPAAGSRQRFVARAGSFSTLDLEGQITQPIGTGALQVLGRYLSTGGFHTVAEENRGPIDTPASSRARWLTGRFRQPLGDKLTATLTVREFGERRGNGTPYQQNSSDETFGSVAVSGHPTTSFQWNAVAYAQSQDFSSTFSSVNATRTAETPASNQFGVPSTAVGVAWIGEWRPPTDAITSFGLDVRDVRGETREDSAFSGNDFTRRRFAGGRQTNAGIFVMHSRPLGAALRGTAGIRVDGWEDSNGHRRDLLNGVQVANDRFADRDGVELSPSAGLVWQVNDAIRLHASGQHAFRRPTLNELYRPFRVGNVITDANPALRSETVTSGEVGAAVTHRGFTYGLTAFQNELHDSVANVTIAQGPANEPGIGFIPAGGEGRRRLNLDRARVQGLVVSANWRLGASTTADVQYLYNDATVRRAAVAPALQGLRLAQVPRHSASAGLSWTAARWTVSPRVRFIGEQFEDDTNTLRLADATVIDLSVSANLGRNIEAFVSAENLADRRIETGRASTGLVNVGMPRMVLAGFRVMH